MPLNIVHDQEFLIAEREIVDDARQVRVTQRRQKFGLSLELGTGLFDNMLVSFGGITQPLECHAAFEHQVFGIIDRTHGALPDQQDQAISISEDLIRVQHDVISYLTQLRRGQSGYKKAQPGPRLYRITCAKKIQ